MHVIRFADGSVGRCEKIARHAWPDVGQEVADRVRRERVEHFDQKLSYPDAMRRVLNRDPVLKRAYASLSGRYPWSDIAQRYDFVNSGRA
jgi:hypothetical protein